MVNTFQGGFLRDEDGALVLSAGSGGSSAEPSIVSGGNLGATYTLDVGAQTNPAEVWLVGTLTANLTLTVSNVSAGDCVKLLLTQDATGGRTLTVTDGTVSQSVTVGATAGSTTSADVFTPDGTTLYIDGEGDDKVDKATVTTKGDLIVATAASTPDRLGIGSDGQVLTADSAQAKGVKWATPSSGGSGGGFLLPPAGSYWRTHEASGFASALTINRLYAIPVPFFQARTITRIGYQPSAGGAASSIVRLGIYSDNAMLPDALLVDAGSINGQNGSNAQELTISHSVAAGTVLWLCLVYQGAATATTLFGSNANNNDGLFMRRSTGDGAVQNVAYVDSVSGALPATFGSPSWGTWRPNIFLKF